MEAHPFANDYPMMEGREWQAFVADIKANGVRVPVVVHKGQIVDGRNRAKAAAELGIDCRQDELDEEPTRAIVWSLNAARRHLPTKTRARIAAEMARLDNGINQHTRKEGGPNGPPSLTIKEAAELMGVGVNSVKRAKAEARAKQQAEEKTEDMSRGRGGWSDVAVRHQLLTVSELPDKAKREPVQAAIAEQMSRPINLSSKWHTVEDLREIDAAAARVVAARRPAEDRQAEHRRDVEALPRSAQERIERAIRNESKLLRESFDEEVRKGIEAQIGDVIAGYERARELSTKATREYTLRAQGLRPFIGEEEYRILLNALHPDREPDREKLTRCFQIVKSLEPYIESFCPKRAA